MRMRIVRLFVGVVLSGLGVGLGAPRTEAQLVSADLYRDIHAGISASNAPEFPLQQDAFDIAPISSSIFPSSGTIPWNLYLNVGGAEASTDGNIVYLAASSQIYTTGNFTMFAGADLPQTAVSDFDAVISISFQVATQTTFTLSGSVSTERALRDEEVVACQYNGVVLAGDSRATPLAPGTYTFDVEHTLYPEETGVLQCAAASSGGMSDANTLTWDVAVNGLPEPGTAAGTLAAVAALAAVARSRAPTQASF
jgi:hypothetical protein